MAAVSLEMNASVGAWSGRWMDDGKKGLHPHIHKPHTKKGKKKKKKSSIHTTNHPHTQLRTGKGGWR